MKTGHFKFASWLLLLIAISVSKLTAQWGGVYLTYTWEETYQYCWWEDQMQEGSGQWYVNDEGILVMTPIIVNSVYRCEEPVTTHYGSYSAYVGGLDPGCSYDIIFGGGWDSVSGTTSWSGSMDVNLDNEGEPYLDVYETDCPQPPQHPQIVSIELNQSCDDWFKQGSSISKSNFRIITEPPGLEGSDEIVLLTTTINSNNLSVGTPLDPGGLGTFTVNVRDSVGGTASLTVNVYDPGREIVIGITPKYDHAKFMNLVKGVSNAASAVGLAVPEPNVTGGIYFYRKYQKCAGSCEPELRLSKEAGNLSGTVNGFSLTSPEWPIWGPITARVKFDLSITVGVSVSHHWNCDAADETCANVSTGGSIAVTGSVCALNCNIVALNVTGSYDLGATGRWCGDSGWSGTVNPGTFRIGGTVTLASFEVASFTYTVFTQN